MARYSGARGEADLHVELAAAKVEAVIPPRVSRIAEIAYDQNAYGLRYLIECFINKIKHYRRVATRYEKTAMPRYLEWSAGNQRRLLPLNAGVTYDPHPALEVSLDQLTELRRFIGDWCHPLFVEKIGYIGIDDCLAYLVTQTPGDDQRRVGRRDQAKIIGHHEVLVADLDHGR